MGKVSIFSRLLCLEGVEVVHTLVAPVRVRLDVVVVVGTEADPVRYVEVCPEVVFAVEVLGVLCPWHLSGLSFKRAGVVRSKSPIFWM